jgi:hypothetical protein
VERRVRCEVRGTWTHHEGQQTLAHFMNPLSVTPQLVHCSGTAPEPRAMHAVHSHVLWHRGHSVGAVSDIPVPGQSSHCHTPSEGALVVAGVSLLAAGLSISIGVLWARARMGGEMR